LLLLLLLLLLLALGRLCDILTAQKVFLNTSKWYYFAGVRHRHC
jgi:hypothetical protein